jgi:membrane protease YdiL (CAAX protease family)
MRAAKVPLPSLLHLHGPLDVAVAIVLVVVVAVAEETIFRGYLLLRFRALDRRPVVGVVLSSLIFALGHGYEGSAGLVTVACSGVAFAVLYLLRGSLVAPMVVHFLQDLVGLVLLP